MKIKTKQKITLRHIIYGVFAFVFFTAAGGSVYFANTDSASAVITNWNAGRIIDDTVFTNSSSMTAQQIQQFLDSKVTSCDTMGAKTSEYGGGTRRQWAESKGYSAPFTCLKDYSENGKSGAQIIYDASAEFGINPQVLLVLLQKEQGLITDTWPLALQYRSATGYGCPDTAPCDSEYYGLTNQVRWAARMFRSIMNVSPGWYTPYTTGNNYIRWSPTASCGGSTVNIENRATQALYNYTPYQPNQAALNADYGTGDGCSAYGNRNFYLYFRDWFGNTTGPEYSATVNSAMLYSDTARTLQVPMVDGKYIVQPGQKLYARVNATNNGREAWDSYTNIGTAGPRDRTSVFYTTDWINPQRPGRVTAPNVATYAIGIFDFTLQAPASQSVFKETFSFVRDGKAWFNTELSFMIQTASTVTSTAQPGANTLASNTKLNQGNSIVSPDGYSSLTVTTDGKLELRRDYKVVWSRGGGASYLVMQDDGNLVLYNAAGGAVWHSETSGQGISSLTLQEDGNLVLYKNSGQSTWSSGTHTVNHTSYPTMTLPNDGIMYKGQLLQSTDRKYNLYFQGDGNVVLYGPSGSLWSSGTDGSEAQKLILQSDGNLVLYAKSGRPLWNSGTAGRGISSWNVQPDGNLVLYKDNGTATWASGTNR